MELNIWSADYIQETLSNQTGNNSCTVMEIFALIMNFNRHFGEFSVDFFVYATLLQYE